VLAANAVQFLTDFRAIPTRHAYGHPVPHSDFPFSTAKRRVYIHKQTKATNSGEFTRCVELCVRAKQTRNTEIRNTQKRSRRHFLAGLKPNSKSILKIPHLPRECVSEIDRYERISTRSIRRKLQQQQQKSRSSASRSATGNWNEP